MLIFLSVLAAFYFDSYRDEKNRETLYKRHLQDFKIDLETNQGKFNYEINRSEQEGSGYISLMIDLLEYTDSIMQNPTRAHADTLMKLVESRSIIGLSEWIFTSPQYNELSKTFYSYIKTDSMRYNLERHYRNNTSRTNYKEAINQYVSQFEDIMDDIDFTAGTNNANRNIIFSSRSRNKIRRIKNTYAGLLSFTLYSKEQDEQLLTYVSQELKLWGVEE